MTTAREMLTTRKKRTLEKSKKRWTHFTRDFFPTTTSICGKEYSGSGGMSFTNKKESVTCRRCLSEMGKGVKHDKK